MSLKCLVVLLKYFTHKQYTDIICRKHWQANFCFGNFFTLRYSCSSVPHIDGNLPWLATYRVSSAGYRALPMWYWILTTMYELSIIYRRQNLISEILNKLPEVPQLGNSGAENWTQLVTTFKTAKFSRRPRNSFPSTPFSDLASFQKKQSHGLMTKFSKASFI